MELPLDTRIWISGLSLSLCVIFPFLILYQIIEPINNDPTEVWFQRSGSVIVTLSIFAELFILLKPKNSLQESSIANIFLLLGLVFSIIGTLIWGYGDLFLQ